MTDRSCAGFAEQTSAFVDDALSVVDRDRLLVHLAGCPSCRHDVEDLRQVRTLLRSRTAEGPAPATLSHRLAAIPVDTPSEPSTSTPSSVARTSVAVAAAVTVALLGVGAVGIAAAPEVAAVTVDPGRMATSEFVAAVSELPLAVEAVQAVLTADVAALAVQRADPDRPVAWAPDDRSRPIGAEHAVAVLERAVSAPDDLDYRGTQNVLADRAGQSIEGTVQVVAVAGQARQTTISTVTGTQVGTGSIPTGRDGGLADTDLVDLIGSRWLLSGWSGAQVAGRAATVVEAHEGGSPHQRPVVARWWVDDETGLLLQQQTYDAAGAVTLSAGFSQLTVGDQSGLGGHLTPRLAVPSTTAALTVSAAPDLLRSGWLCRDEVAGLSLLRLHSDGQAEPATLHMVYADGVETVSVLQQRGRLATAPAGTAWDPDLDAWVRTGSPAAATWQSGSTVVTVVTSGSSALLTRVVDELPRLAPERRTTMERVHAGWVRIVESLNG